MDRSARTLFGVTLVVLALFLVLNNVAQNAALADWGLALLIGIIGFVLLASDRISERWQTQPTNDAPAASVAVIAPTVPHTVPAPAAAPTAEKVTQPLPFDPMPHTPAPKADVLVEASVKAAEPPPEPVVVAVPPVEAKVEPPPAPPEPVVVETPPAPPPVEAKVEPPPPAPEPAPVIEAPPVVAETPKAEPAQSAPAASNAPDDLKVIEGIGPKMENALKAAGLDTYAKLAQTAETEIRAAVQAAGMRFAPSIPTWAEQASYAAKGDWEGLKAFQSTLSGGRKV